MRLAIVRQRYTPYGGAERFVARALAALERAGTDVTLIAREWQDWQHHRALRVDPAYVGRLWRDMSFARAARGVWEREGFDLVQSHERIPGCHIYRAGDGVHRVWLDLRTRHAAPLQRLGIALNPYHRHVCAAERAMFEHPQLRAVICNSYMVREQILDHFRIDAAQLHVIYNGIELDHFDQALAPQWRDATRAELGIGRDDFVFLFVGSGFARKGLDVAIDALARDTGQDARLVVVGRDRHQRRYVEQARRRDCAGRVNFAGAREDVRPLYAAADCFILPTRYDPFPNTVLEALAMGLPVITTHDCGAAEVLAGEDCGWVCAANDPQLTAQAMQQAVRQARLPALRASARACAERFDVDAMAQQLTALYGSLMQWRA